MNKKIKFSMFLSHDEDTEFTTDAIVTENTIEFLDANNFKTKFIIGDKRVRMERQISNQEFIEGETTRSVMRYQEGLILDIDMVTEHVSFDGKNLKVIFDNYINGNFTNKHILNIEIIQ